MNNGEFRPMRTGNFRSTRQHRIILRKLSHGSEDISCLIHCTHSLDCVRSIIAPTVSWCGGRVRRVCRDRFATGVVRSGIDLDTYKKA